MVSSPIYVCLSYYYDANRIARTVFDDRLNAVEAERYMVDGWDPAKPRRAHRAKHYHDEHLWRQMPRG